MNNIEYEIESMKKTMERRLLFIEVTLKEIKVSIQTLAIKIDIERNIADKAAIMTYHGADPNVGVNEE
jgi:hypothetical protein